MIVEQDRIKQERTALTEERKFLGQVIKSAEIYERLSSNNDFQQYVKDVEDRIKAHETNVQSCVSSMTSTPNPMKRMRLADAILLHNTRKEECQALIGFPETTRRSKDEALTRLDQIDRQLKEMNHD